MRQMILVALIAVSSAAFAAKPKPKAPQAPQLTEEQKIEATRVKMVDAATTAIRDSMKDPESARFRRVVVSPKGRAVCGEVNAKNEMGGYVGFRRFIVAADRAGVEGDETYFAETHWQERCVDDVPFNESEVAKKYGQ